MTQQENRGVQRALIILSILGISIVIFLRISKSIWLDEAYSIHLAGGGFSEIISGLKNDNGPPLYYLILSLWTKVFGISESAVRSLSIVFYSISLTAVYIAGKSLYDERTALVCTFLYMVSEVSITHATNVRMYSLLGLTGILSTLFYLRLYLLKSNSRKDLVLYLIVNVAGTFTHYWFMFILMSQIICHIIFFHRYRVKEFITLIFLSFAPFFLLWSPILLRQMGNGSTFWLNKPDIFFTFIKTILDFYGGKPALSVYIAVFLLVVFQFKKGRPELLRFGLLKEYLSEKRTLLFLVILSVSLLVPLIISQVKPIYVIGRYTIIGLFPFVMLMGPLLRRFSSGFLISLFCTVMIITITASGLSSGSRPRKYSDKATAKHLLQHARHNDILVFTSLSRPAVDYYLQLIEPDNHVRKISFPLETASHPGWIDAESMLRKKELLEMEADSIIDDILNGNMSGNNRIWLLYGSDKEIGGIVKERFDRHLVLSEKMELRGSFYNKVLVYKKRGAEKTAPAN